MQCLRRAGRRGPCQERGGGQREAAITTVPDGQLYVVVGRADEQGRWQLRLWWKPFVTLIWAGGGLVALGGFLSLIGRVRREMRHAPPREFL